MARRADDPHDVHVVIHGHFYQPPRENPWLEAVEREPSAHPFPNWNARIGHECYRCNGWARVFEQSGRVVDILNNYLHYSFNFGPTLLSWMEVHQPLTYARILEADRLSIPLRSGHGNAIAQAYGHAILPLCNDRDRLTQIRWGKQDFNYRFGRHAEAMWLPETAINAATVEDLIAEGLRFVILAPRQARRIRPFDRCKDANAWQDVSPDKIDPRSPYRCFSRRDPQRYLDVFFYDGPVAHAISFEKVLDSSKQLVDKLWGAVDVGRSASQLIHAAVDGETFGHHMRHAERALSYMFEAELPQRDLKLTNYAEYLERHPPTHEVELNFGPNDEGSSWSCMHGVGRWYRDCGCNAGSPEGWNQGWRAALRQGVNLVRDEAAQLFMEQGGELLRDPWGARDAYIELLLDRSLRARERFLQQHGRKEGGSMAQQVMVLKLLELQRHSLLAQTSCGWFFNDISGLEAVQILKYAARTVQLIEELSGRNVERRLREVLGEARSNIPGMGSGADIYANMVLPASVSPRRLVAQYAITDRFRCYPEDHRFYGYQIHRVEGRRLTGGTVSVCVGRLQVEFLRTGEVSDFAYALIHFGGHDFHCAVRPFAGIQEFRRFTDHLESIFNRATITELLRVVDAHFGESYFSLQHLLAEEREEVLDALFGHITEHFSEAYTRLYQENHRAVNALLDTGLKLPQEFRMAAEYVLSRRFNQEIRQQAKSHELAHYRGALEVVDEATRRGYQLDQSEARAIFDEMMTEAINVLVHKPSEHTCRQAFGVLQLAEALKIELSLDRAQDLVFSLLRERPQPSELWPGWKESVGKLLERMRLSPALLG